MGVGAELSGTAYFVYPAVSLTANLRVPLGESSLDLVPEAGLTYFFFPMTGMSGNFFIPLGLALTFDDIGVGFIAQNMLSVANILGEGITTIGLEGSIDLFRAGHSSLRIDATVAAGVVWNTKISPVVLFTVSPALGYEYTLGANAVPIPGKPLVTPPLGGENSVPPPSKPQTATTGAS
jgi:hypothetical protein